MIEYDSCHCGTRAVVKAQETAYPKWIFKLAYAYDYKTKSFYLLTHLARRIDSFPSVTKKWNSVLHTLLTCARYSTVQFVTSGSFE